MRNILKWVGIVIGGLVVLIILAVAGLYLSVGLRLNKTYIVQAEALTIPTDAATISTAASIFWPATFLTARATPSVVSIWRSLALSLGVGPGKIGQSIACALQ